MPTLATRGVELAWRESGSGPAVLLIHETAATGEAWGPLAQALAPQARVISYDRRGWGESTAPEGYVRTTVEEQSEDAAALADVAGAPVLAIGAGSGAVIALDLLLRCPELVSRAALIEPPLLQLLPTATEALAMDRRRLEAAAANREDIVELYLGGELPALGAGASRLPDEVTAAGREGRGSVLAELGLSSGWRMPLPRLASATRPSLVFTAPSTPPLLLATAESLAGRLASSELRSIESGGLPPHLGSPDDVAAAALELMKGPA